MGTDVLPDSAELYTESVEMEVILPRGYRNLKEDDCLPSGRESRKSYALRGNRRMKLAPIATGLARRAPGMTAKEVQRDDTYSKYASQERESEPGEIGYASEVGCDASLLASKSPWRRGQGVETPKPEFRRRGQDRDNAGGELMNINSEKMVVR
ncbi:hypothetical protein V492_01802 [Pseudogymnoascus sp. VKM F-4246]|nr:hypothetical protein V492_01802 [Pseudogymnoascus sp. VKM F-4246]